MKISASFLKIQGDKKRVEELEKYTDYMHYDVMDGLFVSNKTIPFSLMKDICVNGPKDIHLMVYDVKKYVDLYSRLKPDYITFHVEATPDVVSIIGYIKSKGIKAGLAINPNTDISLILPYLDQVDLVLVMSVMPGAGGQSFIDVTDRIDYLLEIRRKKGFDFIIEVDGGINDKTINLVRKVDMVVSGSFITDSDDFKGQIDKLRGNGFTLAELMGVIVILSIIAVVVMIAIDNNIRKGRITTCETQEGNIIDGAKAYYVDNPLLLPSSLNGTDSVLLSNLESNGYIEDGLKNPMTNKVYGSSVKVLVTLSEEPAGYTYEVTGLSDDEECK